MWLILAMATAGGAPLCRIVAPTLPRVARLALSFLFGAGWMAFSLLLLSLLSIRWALLPVLLSWAVLPVAAILIAVRLSREGRLDAVAEEWGIDAASAILLMLVLCGASLYSTLAPLWQGDYWAIWGLKGRSFHEASGIDWSFLREPFNSFSHGDYPPLTPLLFDLPAVLSGRWDDRVIGLWYPALGLAALLIGHNELRREADSKLFASIAAIGASGIMLTMDTGLADGPLIAFGTAGALLLRRAMRDPAFSSLPGALLLGLAAMIKNEGMTLVAAATIALLLTAPRRILMMTPAWVMAAIWPLVRVVCELGPSYFSRGTPAERVIARFANGEVFSALLATSTGERALWMVLALVLVFKLRGLIARERLLAVIAAGQFAAFVLAYLATPADVLWHVQNSWGRLASQLAPLIFFACCFLLAHRESPARRVTGEEGSSLLSAAVSDEPAAVPRPLPS